jgi:hypothetical protein
MCLESRRSSSTGAGRWGLSASHPCSGRTVDVENWQVVCPEIVILQAALWLAAKRCGEGTEEGSGLAARLILPRRRVAAAPHGAAAP